MFTIFIYFFNEWRVIKYIALINEDVRAARVLLNDFFVFFTATQAPIFDIHARAPPCVRPRGHGFGAVLEHVQ